MNSQMGNLGYGGQTVKLCSDFPLLSVGTSNLHVVEESTSYLYGKEEKKRKDREIHKGSIGKRVCREPCRGFRSERLRVPDSGKSHHTCSGKGLKPVLGNCFWGEKGTGWPPTGRCRGTPKDQSTPNLGRQNLEGRVAGIVGAWGQ